MALPKGLKSQIEKLTIDKTDLNKKVLKIKKSVDEVNKTINGK